MTADSADVEPSAAASPEERRRFLTLAGLFLAGPSIWLAHFFLVYLVAEALCVAGVDAEVLSLPLLSAVTLLATALAVGAAAVTSVLAYRRWRRSLTPSQGTHGHLSSETKRGHDKDLAFAGLLLGILFIVAILFVGLPAAVLNPC